jgi:hypothetical protein
MSHANSSFDLPVISSVEEFDRSTGSLLERLVFNNRVLVMAFCTLATFFLAYHAKDITLQAGFEKMLPKNHPYVINYQENKKFLKGLGNNLTLSIKGSGESIFEKDYLQTLESLNDQVFFIPGVDRTAMKSLFTPNTRWRVVTEEGFAGGPVMPGYFDGSPQKIEELTTARRRPSSHGPDPGETPGSWALWWPMTWSPARLSSPCEPGIRRPVSAWTITRSPGNWRTSAPSTRGSAPMSRVLSIIRPRPATPSTLRALPRSSVNSSTACSR